MHPISPDRIIFQVADSGIGMSEDQQSIVFDAFVQAQPSTSKEYGGTGLGLALCRDYCDLMGGTISVGGAAGKGSIFTVELPIRSEKI
jgi:signal transduction histidine kinase